MLNIRSCLLATTLFLPTFTPTTHAADSKAENATGNNTALVEVIAARSDEEKARDVYRHPVETLTFFQVEPGMTVVEGLPGGGGIPASSRITWADGAVRRELPGPHLAHGAARQRRGDCRANRRHRQLPRRGCHIYR
ncbi:MAG: hypothetical protein IPG64_19655 [Haliea sp.]|nr:hypothetical protein [Haliea sp.]